MTRKRRVNSRSAGAPGADGLRIDYLPLSKVIRAPRNPKGHDLGALAQSYGRFGYVAPLILNEATGKLVAGHGRLDALQQAKAGDQKPPARIKLGPKGEWLVPVVRGVSFKSDQDAESFLIGDNQIGILGGWHDDQLAQILSDLAAQDALAGTGFDKEDVDDLLKRLNDGSPDSASKTLVERFLVPPFSVFDARQGYWQKRKQAWLSLGIKGELGRDVTGRNVTAGKHSAMHRLSGRLAAPEALEEGGSTTSIFDPVLCELAYRWFCPPVGFVLDPFAGGSVRGIVASRLGRSYLGIDLSTQQIVANREQASSICQSPQPMPKWVEGDARDVRTFSKDQTVDFIFTCPPYADLEVYSDDSRDLSTLAYPAFLTAYSEIIRVACSLLKPDRFACIVVGDVRDKQGFYYGFPSDTIRAFINSGLRLYNEAVLITAAGSFPMCAAIPFVSSRKLKKTHQNVLVFVKGNPKKATAAIGDVEFGVLDTDLPTGDLSLTPRLADG